MLKNMLLCPRSKRYLYAKWDKKNRGKISNLKLNSVIVQFKLRNLYQKKMHERKKL